MPPTLTPSGILTKPKASGAVICRCSRCRHHVAVNPLTGSVTAGRLIGRLEAKSHRQLEINSPKDVPIIMAAPGVSDLAHPTIATAPRDHNGQASQPSTAISQSSLFSEGPASSLDHDVQASQGPNVATQPSPSNQQLRKYSVTSREVDTIASILVSLPSVTSLAKAGLTFNQPPNYLSPPESQISDLQKFALKTGSPQNILTKDQEILLVNAQQTLKKIKRKLDTVLNLRTSVSFGEIDKQKTKRKRDKMLSSQTSTLLGEVDKQLAEILHMKRGDWEEQRKSAWCKKNSFVVDTSTRLRSFGHPTAYQNCPDAYVDGSISSFDSITLTWYLLVAILHLLCGLSHEDCALILATAQVLLKMTPQTLDSQFIDVPRDVRTVIKDLRLLPKTVSYICCPKCFYLYANCDAADDEAPPDRCANHPIPDGPRCNRLLRKMTRQMPGAAPIWTPTREFLYHDIKDWLGRLYSRPGFEEYLDRDNGIGSDPTEVWDIMESSEVQNFLGPDEKPFLKRPGNEGRVMFCFNEDGFNPYGNRLAGKQVSVGGMYLTCLSLPPPIRCKIENMCLVGVVPGPHSPSKDQMNYLLSPLVNDLLKLWKTGVFFTKTPRYPHGRLVRAALLPLACDLPAALQVAGYAHFSSHHFCHKCKQTLPDIDNLDYKNWIPHNWQEDREHALEWLNAKTGAERLRIFEEYGVRWSTLFELPYWDPTLFVMIDGMHAFYLRMLQCHCREVWGMDNCRVDGEAVSFRTRKQSPADEVMEAARQVLKTGTTPELENLKTLVLRQLCFENGLHWGGKGKKTRYLRDLKEFVRVKS